MRKIILLIMIFISFGYSQKVKRVEILIKDISTLEPIEGAVISIDSLESFVTNSKGFVNFDIVKSKISILIKSLGYFGKKKLLYFDNKEMKFSFLFYLRPKPIELEKVTITGNRYKEKLQTRIYELKPSELKKMPAFVEADAVRALQALPSVAIISDMGAQIYLRGGNYDETKILLDNVPLYNPFHLGGLFSMFNSDIIGYEKLYPSNYPPNYEGAISGVLQLQTKREKPKVLSGKASIGLLTSKVSAEVPIKNGAFTLSARRTYLDLLNIPYYYYDLYCKYKLKVENNFYQASILYSRDNYDITFTNNTEVKNIKKVEPGKWGNLAASFEYLHNYKNSFVAANLYFTKYSLEVDGGFKNLSPSNSTAEYLQIDNYISEFGSKFFYNYEGGGHNFQIGFNVKKIKNQNNWDVGPNELNQYISNGGLENIFFDFAPRIFTSSNTLLYSGFYISDEINVSSKINFSLGGRLNYINLISRIYPTFWINFNYNISDKLSFTFNYADFIQYAYTKKESIEKSPLSPFSMYFFAAKDDELPKSQHVSIICRVNQLPFNLKFDLEAFYKNRVNLPSAFERSNTIKFLNGVAYGLEILLKKDYGNLNGWISYTFTRSLKYNMNGDIFPANYDRPHTLKTVFNYNLSKTWTFTCMYTYSSGIPYTPVLRKYIGKDFRFHFVYGNKNSDRVKNYDRLDVGIVGKILWGKYLIKPYLQILNLLNNPNPYNYVPSEFKNDSSEFERGSNFIPSIGVGVEF